MSAKLTRCETVWLYTYVIICAIRRIYVKSFLWIAIILAIAFEMGVKAEAINHTNAVPIAVGFTILALVYIICVLLEREEKRKNRLKHASSKRSKK